MHYLARQNDGLTGHPEHAGYPFDSAWWGTEDWAEEPKPGYPTRSWIPYEQTGYWIDGAIRCGFLTKHTELVNKAKQPLDYVLSHADTEGYLGPRFLKSGGTSSRWTHAVFFRALMAYYSATKDKRIIQALRKHYLSGSRSHTDGREVCNVETILWTYEMSGDDELLRHALDAYEGYNCKHQGADMTLDVMLSEKRATAHGVTYNEIAKLGAILYMHTGNQKYLEATVNAYQKVDRDQMLIDGVHSSSEHLEGKDPLDSHETCDIADYTWSVGYLLMATGNAQYADKIERACFNAAPGAVTSDFKALQYFSCPNQVLATGTSNHTPYFRGHTWMSYRPNPGTECCTGNVHRIMPNFAARMWLRDRSGGVVAALYGPSSITVDVGEPRREVTIVEKTDYPFSETIDFTVHTPAATEFSFSFRIPGWCEKAQAFVNGESIREPLQPGAFFTIRRRFVDNDHISLVLPMQLKISHWPLEGVGIERGPLVFALRIAEDWRVAASAKDVRNDAWRMVPNGVRSTPDFPDWDLLPASPWNYALALDEANAVSRIQVVQKPMSLNPWRTDTAPIELRVPARSVHGWDIERTDSVVSTHWSETTSGLVSEPIYGQFALTPQLPDPVMLAERLSQETETVTLVPYGCTRLRIAVFPRAR
jgi:hypothetical protein